MVCAPAFQSYEEKRLDRVITPLKESGCSISRWIPRYWNRPLKKGVVKDEERGPTFALRELSPSPSFRPEERRLMESLRL